MKKIVFLMSLSLSVVVAPAASLAKLVLDLPPILAASCNSTCTGCDPSCVNPCIACCECPDPCDPSCTNPCPGSCCPVAVCDPCAGGSYDPNACFNSCKKACCDDACDPCVLSSCTTDPCTVCTKFNDTGIDASLCRGTSNAEDCKHGRDADAKTNGNSDGRVGFSLVKQGSCIKDNVTGLLWSPDIGQYTWSQIQTEANNATSCGFSDWRLPTVKELVGIVSYHSSTLAADATFDFPSTTLGYWSGTPVASNTNYAWSVSFANGLSKQTTKTSGLRLRLVRTAE